MKSYEAGASIKATPEAVWEVLTDAGAYSDWDSGVVRVEGTIAPGEKVKVVWQEMNGAKHAETVTIEK